LFPKTVLAYGSDNYTVTTNSISISVTQTDLGGNTSSVGSATVIKDTIAPNVTGISINGGLYKVGNSVTATITADNSAYAAGAVTINGVATTGFTDNGDGTYNVIYTVQEGHTDRASVGDVPVSVVLTDAAGNSNTAYTTAPTSSGTVSIDANSPKLTSTALTSEIKSKLTVLNGDPVTNNDLTFTAKAYGVDGNSVSVALVKPVASTSASISVTGTDITVTLATDANGVITTTAAGVKTLIEGNLDANTLVSAAYSGDGAGLADAVSKTSLSGGADAYITVSFSEAIVSTTLDDAAEIIVKDSTAATTRTLGTTPVFGWNLAKDILTITLDANHSIVSGDTVTGTSATDISGNTVNLLGSTDVVID
jgi:hypothetical protein